MANPNTQVTWVDAREGLPRGGAPVAVATTGRYPADSAEPEGAPGGGVLAGKADVLHDSALQ